MNTKKIFLLAAIAITVFVSGYRAQAQTVVPTCTSATIYGTVTPNGSPTEAWFDWGLTPSYGNSTTRQTFTTNSEYNALLTGLTENTTYYYRAMAQNAFGTATGSQRSFKTANCTVQNPTVTLTANPTSVQYNGSSNLSWSSTNATSCSGTNFNTNGNTSGSYYTGPLTNTITYTITCTSSSGQTATDSVTVTVGSQNLTPTVNLTANPTTVTYNGSSTLTWNSTNAVSCNGTNGINNWAGTKNTSGSFNSGPLTHPVVFSIVCTSSSGQSTSDSVTINVENQTQYPTVTLTADNLNVNYNNATYLRWNSTNATSCYGTNFSTNNSTSGSYFTGNLTTSTTYSITCSNSSGQSAQASVTVNVGGSGTQYPTVNLTADNSNLNYNNGTYIRWNSTNATSCYGTNFSTNNSTSGSYYTGPLTYTTTYNITCTSSSGQSATSSTTVYVSGGGGNYQDPTVSTNSASNIGTNYATLNGYVSANGSSYVNAWFEWGTSSYYYGNQTSQVNYGSTSSSYSYYLSGLNPNTTYYYRAVAQGNYGRLVYGNQMSFTTTGSYGGCGYGNYCYQNQPIVTTYSASSIGNNSAVLNGYVDPNGSYSYSYASNITRWFEWGTSNGYLYTTTNKTYASYAGNFSETIYGLSPNTTYYYRAVAMGNNGQTVYGNTLSFITTGSNYYNNCSFFNQSGCQPTAITNMATNIGNTSARFNGLALINNAVSTTGYFEYGTSQNLGSSTINKTIGSTQSNPFYESMFDLSPNTTYYYRAVVTNQYGTSRGEIVSFRTGSPITYVDTTHNRTRIYRETTVVSNVNEGGISRPSLVFLTVSRNGESITPGSTIEYVINYKNVSAKNLKDIVLQISFPKELQFIEASRGTFSTENNLLVTNIGNLNSQEEGSTRVTVTVSPDAFNGKTVVVTANLAYTIADTNAQEEVFAYSKNTIQLYTGVQQGALAFLFGGNFFPTTLLGWLLIIVFIVLLILAIRKALYGPRPVMSAPANGEHH